MTHPATRRDGMYVLSQGSGQPVLFLHGIPTSCHLWDGVIRRLSGVFTCIAVDLPGMGRTPATAHGLRDLDSLASDIERLRIQCNVESWRVVGHDAGCAIAVHYANRFPKRVARLALLSPSIFPDLKPFYLFEFLRLPVVGELLAPFVSLLFWQIAMRLALSRDRDTMAIRREFQAPFTGLRGAWRLMALLRWGNPSEVLASIPSMLPKLQVPTLIFHGTKDPAIPQVFATRASALIPMSEVIFLECGHFLPMHQPEVIAMELLRFFKSDEIETIVCESADVAVMV
jgi:pimeloyl-ACP methyl ester carboxylesterase